MESSAAVQPSRRLKRRTRFQTRRTEGDVVVRRHLDAHRRQHGGGIVLAIADEVAAHETPLGRVLVLLARDESRLALGSEGVGVRILGEGVDGDRPGAHVTAAPV